MPTNTRITMWTPTLPMSLPALLRQVWPVRALADEAVQRGTSLRAGDARRLRLRPGTQLTVLEGVLWLTVKGDARDHVLGAGDTWVVGLGRGAVVQAVRGPARYRLS